MPSHLFAAFEVWHLFVFSSDLHGRLDLELLPKLFYFSTVRRLFAFVVLLPPSTADVACPRFVHTDEPWRFRTMSRFSIVSFPPRFMRLVTTWSFPRYFASFFARHYLLYCCCWTFLAPWHTSIFCWTFLASWRTSSED